MKQQEHFFQNQVLWLSKCISKTSTLPASSPVTAENIGQKGKRSLSSQVMEHWFGALTASFLLCQKEDERICRETNPLVDNYSQVLTCKTGDYDYLVRLFIHYGSKAFLPTFLLTTQQLVIDINCISW